MVYNTLEEKMDLLFSSFYLILFVFLFPPLPCSTVPPHLTPTYLPRQPPTLLSFVLASLLSELKKLQNAKLIIKILND